MKAAAATESAESASTIAETPENSRPEAEAE